ncbi:MAG: MoxR family ATPase [Phycisphaerae bacterium]|nr:MAG: MoxR family ATPase [Planctomycetota bacterium]KAB2941286.1 MAG: MoxR family ATPase [Phycisphaerae bacterium]MBE7458435.1 MoxR family ATPase [Planctomycetia bacterium]MCK6464934.1 MoxR family ATPase [Phycisphaerae bacterium]MCL4719177.1 MoxR family ATPase [Phycisphaerae bacterium]
MAVSQLDVKQIGAQVQRAAEPFARLIERIHDVIVGQDHLLHQMMIALLTRGHLLVEGVPGLAKTLAVSCLARGIATAFQRIQFTPDLLPADLIGTQVYRASDGQFVVQKGPIFTHVLLADEINRAPAKVQSALLQAMQERQVTIGKETFTLEEPFLVLATQNPIEQEGTYPLPEAQVDRFMMKVVVTYPTKAQERVILDRMATTSAIEDIEPVMSPADLLSARRVVDEIYMDDKIKDYIVDLVTATRDPSTVGLDIRHWIQYGASPRTTIALALGAKASAFLSGRGYVTPQDVKNVAMDVLRHRVILTYEAEAEEKTSQDTVQLILDHVPVP